MKNQKREKLIFICFLLASLCFYINGIIDIFFKKTNNWVISICLGSAFFCLSTTHLNKK